MDILYAVVANEQSTLAKYASVSGNFCEVSETILKSPTWPGTFGYRGNFFHYVLKDGIKYLCITDKDINRSRASEFLDMIKSRFQKMYGNRALTAPPYAFNDEFSKILKKQMQHYYESMMMDSIYQLQNALNELKEKFEIACSNESGIGILQSINEISMMDRIDQLQNELNDLKENLEKHHYSECRVIDSISQLQDELDGLSCEIEPLVKKNQELAELRELNREFKELIGVNLMTFK